MPKTASVAEGINQLVHTNRFTHSTEVRKVSGVAKAARLHPNLDLAQACADFYLLERIVTDLSRIEYDPLGRGEGRNGTILRVPRFGYSKTNTYQLAEAQSMFNELCAFLAPEFSTYLEMACAGEARYGNMKPDCEVSCTCNPGCGEIEHIHYGGEFDPEDCVCEYETNEHEHDEGCEEEHEEHEHSEACCVVFVHEHEDDCYPHTVGTPIPVPDELADYLEGISHYASSGATNRISSWRVWLGFRNNHPEPEIIGVMVGWLRDAFPNVQGFGGEAWAMVARIVYSYQSGQMSARTFIDRCWTLEHNGGCIFNKLYEDLVVDNLKSCLEVQACRPYEELVQWGSPGVANLWERSLRIRKMTLWAIGDARDDTRKGVRG